MRLTVSPPTTRERGFLCPNYIFLTKRLHNSKNSCNFAVANDLEVMSTAALQNVWNGLLAFNLTAANKRWLAERLLEEARADEESTVPYTVEELQARIDLSEQQSANGQYKPVEEVLDQLERNYAIL